MGRRLILDTNVLIAYERGTMDRSSLDDDELAIASISVAEYRVGIELADSAERAAERARALASITTAVDVLDYTQATAASPRAPARSCPPVRYRARSPRPDHRRPRGADRADDPEPRRTSPLRQPPRSGRRRAVTDGRAAMACRARGAYA